MKIIFYITKKNRMTISTAQCGLSYCDKRGFIEFPGQPLAKCPKAFRRLYYLGC